MVRFPSFVAAALAAALSIAWLAGCAASLGPGYLVETQEIRVSFEAQPQPVIRVAAEYRLTNTGNQPLESLHVRLPGRRFRLQAVEASWDGNPAVASVSPENPRDTRFRLPQTWKIGETHVFQFSYAISSVSEASGAPAEDEALGFSSDAFFLPAEGWHPGLLPERGVFGFGGVPPKKWNLIVEVPAGFLVHASGDAANHSAKGGSLRLRFVQTEQVFNPFVVAGRYRESRADLAPDQKIRFWSRSQPDAEALRQAGRSLSETSRAYDALLGPRRPSHLPLWIVECPLSVGCISARGGGYSVLLEGRAPNRYADLASWDTVLVDPRAPASGLETSAGPALAAGWLGYGQSPGFYEQQPPMSALPAFAAALVREATSGPDASREIIARALRVIPQNASADNPAVTRAKSLLLFYALRERVGSEAFEKALQHMLYARRGRDLQVADLISALETQSHQTVGPLVRQWLKRPGVPDDFRARHREAAARQESSLEEALE